jgi:hypothetical protein
VRPTSATSPPGGAAKVTSSTLSPSAPAAGTPTAGTTLRPLNTTVTAQSPASKPTTPSVAASTAANAPAKPTTPSAASPAPAGATTAKPTTPASGVFVPDPKAVQQLASMGFTLATIHYALWVTKNRADHAAEFLLEKSEAEINSLIAKQRAAAAPTGASASAPGKPTTPVATGTVVSPATSTASPKAPAAASSGTPVVSIANPNSSVTGGPASYSSSSSSDNTPRGNDADAVNAAMAAVIAKREALKKKQAPQPLRKEPSQKAVYDRLSEYKTKGLAACEAQEAEDRERRESQERRRRALKGAGIGGSAAETSSDTSNPPALSDVPPANDEQVVRPSSAPPRRGVSASDATFENLFNKKTQSMMINEKREEEERALQERKLKKSDSNNASGSESEVFDKLHTKKLKAHEVAEQVAQEEKARLAKLEAQITGKTGAALPPRSPSPLLRKTQSAMIREQDIAGEKARLAEAERLELEKRPAPLHSSRDSSPAKMRRSMSMDRLSLNGDRASLTRRSSGNAEDSGGDTEDDVAPSTGRRSIDSSKQFGAGSPSKLPLSGSGRERGSSFRDLNFLECGSFSSISSPRLDVKVTAIQGLVPRAPMNFKVVQATEHSWEGRVCAPWRDVGNMMAVKGSYADKEQCIAITAASAPPTYVVQVKNSLCKICEEPFNKYLKAENCRNCGQLVCPDCSAESWPQSMLPETYNETKSPQLRVCKACDQAMERFAAALKSGDLDVVQALYRMGNINLHHPYVTLPEAPYAVRLQCGAAAIHRSF